MKKHGLLKSLSKLRVVIFFDTLFRFYGVEDQFTGKKIVFIKAVRVSFRWAKTKGWKHIFKQIKKQYLQEVK